MGIDGGTLHFAWPKACDAGHNGAIGSGAPCIFTHGPAKASFERARARQGFL